VRNKFAFLWLSWFFWFLLLALVYVPFGKLVNELLQRFKYWPFTIDEYEEGVPALDSAFVTPLVVTQILNLVIKNLLPYWSRQKRHQVGLQQVGASGGHLRVCCVVV
jgi:anoctamin-10